jgi:hypothetical protein
MEKQISNMSDVIKAASASPLGIIALSVILLSLLAFYFFRREHVNVKIGIFVSFALGISLLVFAMISKAGSTTDNFSSNPQHPQPEVEIWANWTENQIRENPITQARDKRLTENHHCSSDCQGEPTRTTYTLTLDKQNEKGSFRKAELKCLEGPCSFSHVKEIRTFNPRLIVATFDVWSWPMTWELTAEWVTTTRIGISKKTPVHKVLKDSIVFFTIPESSKDLHFLGKTPEGNFFVRSEDLKNFNNGWIRFLNQNTSNGINHYNFLGTKPYKP